MRRGEQAAHGVRGALLVPAWVVCSVLFAACGDPDDATTVPARRLALDFDHLGAGELPPGPLTLVDDQGAEVDGTLLASGVDAVPVRPDLSGGSALALPGRSTGPEAVAALKVSPPDPDELSPGVDRVTLEADVVVEATSVGANVVQRGLFSDAGQVKLQVDRGVPSCRVKGTDGAVLVKGDGPLTLRSWYRLRCVREGDAVTLTVQGRSGDGWGDPDVVTRSGAIGSIDIPPTTPLAIGAKLSSNGSLVPGSPDQFHGLIDDILVELH